MEPRRLHDLVLSRTTYQPHLLHPIAEQYDAACSQWQRRRHVSNPK
jgi:hypothetical protein